MRCPSCKEVKNINEFYLSKKGIYYSRCKECMKLKNREYRKKYPQQHREYSKKSRERNPEKRIESSRKWYNNNKEQAKKASFCWAKNNPEKRRALGKRADIKRRKNINVKLNLYFSNLIRHSLRGNKNGHHWESIVGYDLKQLKKHLKKGFLPGMDWNNYGNWHIDHIIPVSAFNFNSFEDTDFKRCWDLSNLQPLWKADNISKHDKIIKDFQPSFSFYGG